MRIKKILNNNAIISENDQTEEIIITGKDIAFGKKAGDLIDRDKIEKTFILKKTCNWKKLGVQYN